MDEFEAELKSSFLEEAEQAIADVENAFIELESDPENREVLDKIFRLAHNLKGSSKAVGFDDMGEFTHSLESFLLKLKEGTIPVTPNAVSLLLECSDHIQVMIAGLKENFNAQFDSAQLISQLNDFQPEESGGSASPELAPEANIELLKELGAYEEPAAEAAPKESVELDDDFSEPVSEVQEEAVFTPPAAEPEPEKAPAPTPVVAESTAPAESKAKVPERRKTTDESIRVSLGRIETLVNYVSEMSILQSVMREQVSQTESLLLKKTVHQLGKVMKEVQDLSMSLHMVQIKPIFQKMQRIVRDTSNALDKNVHLRIVGEETEVDKTVLEKIGDPLVHLVRNSVDHGIEDAAERKEAGKTEAGQVELRAKHQGGRLVIQVVDDGGGLKPEKIKSIAVQKGLIAEDANLSDKECQMLIFHPGFSTKEVVTDVSGRGVGMDVVKTNIESLGGEIEIDSKVGLGTTFRISLPLTLAIIDAMVVQLSESRFVVPLNQVNESVRPKKGDIKHTTGIGDVLLLRGENIPLYRLSELINIPAKNDDTTENLIVMVVSVGKGTAAIVVDDIIGQYQVVIKQLGPEAQDFKGISATTILGDGKPALILELAELIEKKQARKPSSQRRLAA